MEQKEIAIPENKNLEISSDFGTDGKIVALANDLVKLSKDDRARSLTTFKFIKNLIDKVQSDNDTMDKALETLLTADEGQTGLSKMELQKIIFAIVSKKDPATLIRELNNCLQISMNSNSNLVKLTELMVKMKLSKDKNKKDEDEEGGFVSSRSKLINELKVEQ